MKKQLLIAAVAATMGTAAIADISITGNMKVNYTNTDTNGTVTNQVGHEANLALAGKNGNTSVHIEMALDDANKDATEQATVVLEDVHLTTMIGDVKLKTGTWNGSDTILDEDSARTAGNYIVSTTMSGVALSVEGDTEEASTSVKVAGSVSGVALSYKAKATQDEVTVAGSVAGVDIAYANIDADAAASDKSSVSLNYSTNGFDFFLCHSLRPIPVCFRTSMARSTLTGFRISIFLNVLISWVSNQFASFSIPCEECQLSISACK